MANIPVKRGRTGAWAPSLQRDESNKQIFQAKQVRKEKGWYIEYAADEGSQVGVMCFPTRKDEVSLGAC